MLNNKNPSMFAVHAFPYNCKKHLKHSKLIKECTTARVARVTKNRGRVVKNLSYDFTLSSHNGCGQCPS